MTFTLRVWRQKDAGDPGRMEVHEVRDIIPDMSFLEMLDVLNQRLILDGKDPIAFDHDCRDGICGTCGAMINGVAHGPLRLNTLCQLYMRHFSDGDTIVVEPWRAGAFPVICDLVVDRSALDRLMHAGGYISVRAGGAPDAHAILVSKAKADLAMDAAACIGCGACVAACPNASPMLFLSAKVGQYALLPQGQAERVERVRKMVTVMEREGFGGCSSHGECEAVCPKGVKLDFIARLNRELVAACFKS
jgi:succinate dehydrogenase / fumarate reductase, iron-sulfur subunit